MDAADPYREMVSLAGGIFYMGSDNFYPEERPVRRVRVAPFWIDRFPVTNARFEEFVRATGYRTVAEMPPDPTDYPGLAPELAQAGSLVFRPTSGPVSLGNPTQWWAFIPGADWRHPAGPESSIEGLMHHPVVHIAHADAEAYAKWRGKCLPTEAEWEFAALGGLDRTAYSWGNEFCPDGVPRANYWQGQFPYQNLRGDGHTTTPIGAFPDNGYGLGDMIGNVWEWTDDWWSEAAIHTAGPCCVAENPRGGSLAGSLDPEMPGIAIGRKVIKGGSHLCAPNYCQRYRPAARTPQMIESTTSHIGFRCVLRAA
jgi:formylglycine-generating enzyme required for sulfatase activity